MSDERKIFLYFLTKPNGVCYTFRNGNLGEGQYQPLDKSPGGWIEQGISFGRSFKYRGINRTFTQPFKFVDDGASIIRTLFYQRKGIEEPLVLIILKWNPDNDQYEPYYKGEVDLSKIDDQAAEGVTVNVMEGGIVKLLKSFENAVYEFPCDGTIPQNKLVRLDGVKFDDTFTYSTYETSYRGSVYTVPLVYQSNTGYNANSSNGPQAIEDIDNIADYVASSSNYFYKYFQATNARVRGTIKFRNEGGVTNNVNLLLVTSKNRTFTVYNDTVLAGQTVEVTIDQTIAVDDEAVFLIFTQPPSILLRSFTFYETTLNVEFKSEYKETSCWAISAADLWSLIVAKVGDGKYPADSDILKEFPNLMLTSGDAIRKTSNAVLKTSLSDFFSALSVVLCGSLSNQKLPGQNESLFFESIDYVFNSDVITMDLGEVSEFKVSVANEWFFNTIKTGYSPQNYDEQAGRQEFNTTALWKVPITRIVKELSLLSPYRADPFGITYTRIESPGKSTTKNASDNSVFFLNVNPTPEAVRFIATNGTTIEVSEGTTIDIPFETFSGDLFTANAAGTRFTFNQLTAYLFEILGDIYGSFTATAGTEVTGKLYIGADIIRTEVITATGSLQSFRMNFDNSAVISPGQEVRLEVSADFGGLPYVVSINSVGLNLRTDAYNIYSLNRPAYDSVTGVDNPDRMFNIDMLTPARILRRNGKYIRSMLHNQVDADVEFQTLDKNKNLVTTQNGVTIIESASVRIGRLDAPIFYPYVISFKTQVPINFMELMDGAANGHIQLSYNGKTFYGFPIEVSVKPALNDSQEWKLLLSTKTNLNDLVDLDVDGLNYDIMGEYTLSIPHLCPVKFVPLNPSLDPHYHFVHMDADWFKNQVKFYIAQANYLQPWQVNDTADIQCRTNGLGPVSMNLYDCSGQIVKTVSLDQVETPAIVAPNALFEGRMAFNDVEPGQYAIVLTAGSGEAVASFISEVVNVQVDWPMTLLLEYKNNRNKQSTVFSEGYYPSFRIPGWLDSFEPGSKFAVYEDQPADIQLLNGIPFRRYKLNIGTNDGVPPWVIDKVNRIMLLTDTKIDGLAFTRNADAQFEKVDVPGWPMKYWSLDIREAKNRDSVTLSTDGELDNNLLVINNINTRAFGDGSTDGVVQVQTVD